MRIIDRLDIYIREKGINDNQVTVNAGLSVGLLNNARKGSSDIGKKTVEKILTFYQDLNRVWLITGEGPMLKKEFSDETESNQVQKIPLYDIVATGGLLVSFQDQKSVPLDYISLPDLPAVDGAVYVRGDSMSPLIKSGDIIIYKKVALSEDNIMWGQIYLLSYTYDQDSYTSVKYLRRSDRPGYVRLVSENPNFDPQDIQASSITAIAIVKASITFHTIE
ncbi:MAG: S24 family peptidase [Prevotella sp.]|nr:S24 family peptidase [Prevotella sp.]MBR2225243.1 S24 family peptidase [Bacteroidales bacterium]MBR3595189.1 S24 family peptidase [Candidatus Saccharibacteria bacterium]